MNAGVIVMKMSKNNTVALSGFLILILLANGHLFQGQLPNLLNYDHGKVIAGQWWRIITYSFAHISWYHLILDVSATLLLWQEVKYLTAKTKLALISYISMMVLLISILFSPYLTTIGLSGLSGLAHGLGVFVGFLKMEKSFEAKIDRSRFSYSGLLLSGSIIIKCIYEVFYGQALFSSLHRFDLGFPIVHAHLGGAVGGLSFFLILYLKNWVVMPKG